MKAPIKKYWLAFLLLYTVCQSFTLVAASAQERALPEVLEEISTTYKVFFSFDFEQLKNVKVAFQIVEQEPVEKVMKRLLDPNGLGFETFDKKYYVIFKKADKKQTPKIEIKDESIGFLPNNLLKNRMLSAIVLEETTQAPVYDAFIFIRNSSISTTTDLSGTFQLDIGDLQQVELVVTHLNYETKTIKIPLRGALPETILLKAKSLEIAQVTVASKRSKSKKRKRWMKRFKAAFFGETKNRKSVKIENPEVIWFEERGRNIKAEAVDYLSIVNEALGYKMRF